MAKKPILPLLKQAASDWAEDRATRLAAALAYYTMLSIAPLLVISIKFIGFWYQNTADVQKKVTGYLENFVGPQSAEALQAMTQKALEPGSGIFATIMSSVVLLFSAGGVFGELQDAMDVVWEVKPKPDRSWIDTVKERFFSMTLVLGTAFILLVSLVVNTVIAGMVKSLGVGWLLNIANFVLSLGIVTVLFALILKYLPDVKIPWKPVWYGAILTAILFTIGKMGLAWYLGRGTTTSVYGAAGSLAALLIWTYYSGLILFFGAEFAQALVKSEGNAPAPAENAVKMTEQDRAQRGIPRQAALAHIASLPRPMPSDRPAVLVEQPSRKRPLLYGAAGLAAGAALGGGALYLMTRQTGKPVGKSLLEQRREQLAELQRLYAKARRSLAEARGCAV